MNAKIIYSFKLYLTEKRFPVMYSQLLDGNFTKTFMRNERLEIEFITRNEYAIALAYNGYTTYE